MITSYPRENLAQKENVTVPTVSGSRDLRKQLIISVSKPQIKQGRIEGAIFSFDSQGRNQKDTSIRCMPELLPNSVVHWRLIGQ